MKTKTISTKTISVVSFKGGVGKTTTAFHLAAALAGGRRKTVLIDGDPNRSALQWAEEADLGFRVVDEATDIDPDAYAYLVIDTQARPSMEDLRVLAANSDIVLVPSTPDRIALDVTIRTVEALEQHGISNYAIVLNIVPPAPSRDGQEAYLAIKQAGYPVLKSQIVRRAVYKHAALASVPVGSLRQKAAKVAWEDYTQLAKEVQRSIQKLNNLFQG